MNALKHGGRSRAFLEETRSIGETLRRAARTLLHIQRLVRISGMTAKRGLRASSALRHHFPGLRMLSAVVNVVSDPIQPRKKNSSELMEQTEFANKFAISMA